MRAEAIDFNNSTDAKVVFLCHQGIFSIDPETGTITVMDQLDREEQNTFTLVLEAWDNYKFGYAAGESRNAFHQVT